jgi:hypothetical protein
VTTAGIVKGIAEGSATITVTTSDGGYTATCEVTVSSSVTTTIGDETDYSSVTLTSSGNYSSSSAGGTVQYLEYSSTASDVPAVKAAPGGSLTLRNCKATKSGNTSLGQEGSGFYGYNAGVLASSSSSASSYSETNKATTLTLTDCTIKTTSIGSNGAFAFGQGAVVNLDHVTIVTTGDNNARGVDATYGGTINISNSEISTQGGSCAAFATDRYTGAAAPKVNITNCAGTTAGTGSPGIYCTGTFVVEDSTMTATGSEAACIEGKNSITLTNSSMSGTKKWGVIIYQSMSGDSSTGTGNFSMTGGTLTNSYSTGPMFFVCDTSAVITLNAATLVNSSSMLLVAGKASTASSVISNVNSSWGSLGGTVTFNATNQTLSGEIIICDSSSSLAMTLTGSSLAGTINNANTSCTISLTLDSASSWKPSAVSYITSLSDADTTYSNIDSSYDIYANSATASSYSAKVSLSSGGILYIK